MHLSQASSNSEANKLPEIAENYVNYKNAREARSAWKRPKPLAKKKLINER
jgi:hypothetical protein